MKKQVILMPKSPLRVSGEDWLYVKWHLTGGAHMAGRNPWIFGIGLSKALTHQDINPPPFFYLFPSAFRSEAQRDAGISSKGLPAAAQRSQCSQHPGPDQCLG